MERLVSLPAAGTSGATISVPASSGLTVNLDNSGTLTGTTFDVGNGTGIELAGGTYVGSTSFNLGLGATADLTGGQNTTYGGTLTGSGSGIVNLASAAVDVQVGGLILNFPSNLFQWTGGAFSAALGEVTNQGALDLPSSGPGTTFTLNGSFINSGSLTVGAGSTFKISGAESETSGSLLQVQIGGTPASNKFGQLAVTGKATLAGTFTLALVNGFTASAGQDFKVITFASATGTFATFNLGSSFSETLNPTSLDLTSTVVSNNGTISGSVFRDFNLNGVQDAGEPGVAGQTVFLDTNNNGVLDAGEPTSITTATGAYSFTSLAPGSYMVRQGFYSERLPYLSAVNGELHANCGDRVRL